MEWYVPITILPGISLLILSTSNQMLSLSEEIGRLLSGDTSAFNKEIAALKIKQLERLTKSITLLYLSAANFVLSGILKALINLEGYELIPNIVLVVGVGFVLIALVLLIRYGFHAISIRKMQHQKSMNP